MSGAAEGIAGLALSVVSVASLFTTCIECFDIVVAGKNFSEDYEQLCALFSLQRARFGLWGESVGLVPNPIDGSRLRYDANIDRPDIRPGVERILNNIRLLLQEAGRVDERYGLKSDIPGGNDISTSQGMQVFRGSFERFKSRILKNQKQKSAWKVTRWAIHDANKFEGMINRLEKFVDGLESITKSLGLLEEQHARLREEINSISDMQSLRLLRDAASSHGNSSQNDVSDTASRRLVSVAESIVEQQSIGSNSILQDMEFSFTTARTRPSTLTGGSIGSDSPIPGAWPRSIKSQAQGDRFRALPQLGKRPLKDILKPKPSCEQCLGEHYQCAPGDLVSCSRCVQTNKSCSFLHKIENAFVLEPPTELQVVAEREVQFNLPQNQRLLNELMKKPKPRKVQSFAAGDADYGKCLTNIKKEDKDYCLSNSVKMLAQAHSGSSAAKRMFFELRNIRMGMVPFVSAAPLENSLDKVLASIEGPPETPYEGGVFWITVRLSEIDPMGPPLMRFHTKVYHPNISPQGHICTDFRERWSTVLSARESRNTVTDQSALWYHGKSSKIQWTLGALLTAICGLLATPDVDDPLVPEIAQKYLEDYDGYCEAARLYTRRYAVGRRPDESCLMFLEDKPETASPDVTVIDFDPGQVRPQQGDDVAESLRLLREKYDDSFPGSSKDSDSINSTNSHSQRVTTPIPDLRGPSVQLTEEAVSAAAGDESSGKEVMTLLLDRRGTDVPITEAVVEAATGNRRSGKEVMTLLLDRRGADVKITEEVVKAAACNTGSGKEVMTLLLDRRGADVKITEEVVKAAAGNTGSGKAVMTLLLDRRGAEVKITEEVVKAAAGNRGSGKEVMTLLLGRRGADVPITEEVVKAVADNGASGKEVMTLLLDRRGADIKITEEVVKAAAGNTGSGKEVMTLLLDRRGAEVKITKEVVEAAAGNWFSGKEVMTLLLDRRGAEVKITEEVVKAAACNTSSGKEVMTLLLDRRGAEVKITEEVVEAVAGNWRRGKETMTLLLDRRKGDIPVIKN